MDNFWQRNKIFVAVTIWVVILGWFIYAGIKSNEKNSLVIPSVTKTQTIPTVQSVAPKINTNLIISSEKCGVAENTIVTKVIDGDTVVVEGGYHVRLLGMDADETGYPCYQPAKTRLEDLVLSKQITLEKDVSDVDQYGRCLRYIFVGNANIDTQLVKEGLAVARFYEPDVKYKSEITAAEQQAQHNKTGCKWSGDSQTAQ